MSGVLGVLKILAILIAAMMLGNWFVAEVRRSAQRGDPWFRPYLSLPGVMILICIILPVILWAVTR